MPQKKSLADAAPRKSLPRHRRTVDSALIQKVLEKENNLCSHLFTRQIICKEGILLNPCVGLPKDRDPWFQFCYPIDPRVNTRIQRINLAADCSSCLATLAK